VLRLTCNDMRLREKYERPCCRFLYYEEASLTDENVMYVIYAARKYRVAPLIDLCQRHVDKAISAHRVLGMLHQSLTFADEELRDRCLSYVRSSTSDVLRGQQFVDVSEDVLTMIVDQSQLSVLEVDLFRACIDWASRQLRRDDSDATVDGAALRRTLHNILPRIRFPTMTLEQFSTAVVPLGILNTDETCELYTYLTCPVKPETRFSTVSRCVNILTVLTMSTQYKLKTISSDRQCHVLKCHGNVNKPIRLHQLRFIAHEVTAGSKATVEVDMVKLEQDGRATELSFSSKTKRTEAFDQETFRHKPRASVSLWKTKKVADVNTALKKSHQRTDTTAFPYQKLSPVFRAVGEARQVAYFEEPEVETKRVNVKSDAWTRSTLTTSGKVYEVVHVRWDGEDLLLDEGDFTLSYGFSVTMTAANDENVNVDDDDDDDDDRTADIKQPPFMTVLSDDAPIMCIRRLDHKRFESNDVAFTLNFPSGPLMAFAFSRL